MAKDSLAQSLKNLIYNFVDNGKILNCPKDRILRERLDERRIRFIKALLELLLNTDLLDRDVTIPYLTNKNKTLRRVAKQANRNKHTVQTRIFRDMNKIKHIFKDSKFLINVTGYLGYDISEYEKNLASALMENCKENPLENINLNFPRTGIVTDINDGRLEDFIMSILPYHKCHMLEVENSLDLEALAYVRYIMSAKSLLNEKGLERRVRLKILLGIED